MTFTPAAKANSPTPIVGDNPPAVCKPVSQLVADASDVELEMHIQDLGHHMELAYDRGDREAAVGWLDLQKQAIARRSPAQLARMQQVIDDGLDFFQTAAARDARMLQARGLA